MAIFEQSYLWDFWKTLSATSLKKDPKSAYYGFLFERNIKSKKLRIMLRKQYKSNQNMLTNWDAWDNKIEILQFENSVDLESFIEYKILKVKFFNSLKIR